MTEPKKRNWWFALLVMGSLALLGFGVYYTFVLHPYVRAHRLLKSLAARDVQMAYFPNEGHRDPLEYGAMCILGKETVHQPYLIDFSQAAIDDDDLRHVGTLIRTWELHLQGQPITNAGLAHLSGLTPKTLNLSRTLVGSGSCRDPQAEVAQRRPGFEALAKNRWIRALYLRETNVNDQDLEAISKWATPEVIDLTKTCVTDAGMPFLNAMLPHLDGLNLSIVAVTPAGLKSLNLQSLKSVSFRGIQIGADLPAIIANCRDVETLNLSHAGLSAEHIRDLPQLKQLREIYLRDNPLTDEAISHLSSIETLSLLDLRGETQVTARKLGDLSTLKSLTTLALNKEVVADPECLEQLRKIPNLKHIVVNTPEDVTELLPLFQKPANSRFELHESLR